MLKNTVALSFPIRCFFIAQSYVLVKKWSEALVLYDRVLKYADEVNSDAGAFKNSLKVSQRPLLFLSPEQLAVRPWCLLRRVLLGQPWDVVSPSARELWV